MLRQDIIKKNNGQPLNEIDMMHAFDQILDKENVNINELEEIIDWVCARHKEKLSQKNYSDEWLIQSENDLLIKAFELEIQQSSEKIRVILVNSTIAKLIAARQIHLARDIYESATLNNCTDLMTHTTMMGAYRNVDDIYSIYGKALNTPSSRAVSYTHLTLPTILRV